MTHEKRQYKNQYEGQYKKVCLSAGLDRVNAESSGFKVFADDSRLPTEATETILTVLIMAALQPRIGHEVPAYCPKGAYWATARVMPFDSATGPCVCAQGDGIRDTGFPPEPCGNDGDFFYASSRNDSVREPAALGLRTACAQTKAVGELLATGNRMEPHVSPKD